MDTRKIAQLAQLMSTHELSEISLETSELKLTLKRGRAYDLAPAQLLSVPASVPVAAAPAAGTAAAAAAGAPAAAPPGTCILSPIVGTFYIAPAPDAPPFVKPGDKVGAETVVCIVEAMKVMNEIKAEMSGVVRRVLVENGTPVEFGQPLFELEPA